MAQSAALLVLLLAGALLAGYFMRELRDVSAYDNLREYAVQEGAGKEVRDIGELPVEELRMYAQATCARAGSAAGARAALRAQLRGVPAAAVEDIVAGAVVDGASVLSSVQNTTGGVERDGVAYSYVSFWSTQFRARSPVAPEAYDTCVSTAGVRLVVAEHVADWRTTRRERLAGSRPCECGFVWCERCPIFIHDTTRSPILKRHSLSLRKQVDLHNWMVLQAVERAKSIAPPRRSLAGSLRKAVFGKRPLAPAGTLEALRLDTFFGDAAEPPQKDDAPQQSGEDHREQKYEL